MPNAKIGVLYQNDAYGKNYYAGLRVGLGAKKSQIVSAQSYDVTQTSLAQQILALKAAGSRHVRDLRDAVARRSRHSSTATKVGWSPTATFVEQRLGEPGVHAARGVERRQPQRRHLDELSRRSPTYAPQANTVGRQAGEGRSSPSTRRRCCRASTAATRTSSTGSAQAWTMVYALQHAGKTPTRAGLMKALKSMNNVDGPVPLSGDQAADIGDGQLPDRAGDHDQVDRAALRETGRRSASSQRRSLDTARL